MGFTLLFSAMMALGVLLLVVGFVALGCFVAATVVSIVFFLRRKRRAAEGKKLGWLVAIPIALYVVSIPVLIFLAMVFLPGGFTSDYSSCVSAIASHDEDGLQRALESSDGSIALSGEGSYESLTWEALSYNDAVCLRAVLEHAEEQGRPVDLNRPIADPDNADEEECALLIAVQSPVVSCEVLRVLLEFGADPDCSSASGSGTTPLPLGGKRSLEPRFVKRACPRRLHGGSSRLARRRRRSHGRARFPGVGSSRLFRALSGRTG